MTSTPHPVGHRRNPLTSTPTGGRILSASQLLWFRVWPPRGYGVLTVTGRRTGKRRRRCVRAVEAGDTAYLVAIGANAQWVRNTYATPLVSLRLRGGNRKGTARKLRATEVDAARAAYCDSRFPFDAATHLVHMRGRPTSARIRALLEHWFTHGEPVAVDLAADRR